MQVLARRPRKAAGITAIETVPSLAPDARARFMERIDQGFRGALTDPKFRESKGKQFANDFDRRMRNIFGDDREVAAAVGVERSGPTDLDYRFHIYANCTCTKTPPASARAMRRCTCRRGTPHVEGRPL